MYSYCFIYYFKIFSKETVCDDASIAMRGRKSKASHKLINLGERTLAAWNGIKTGIFGQPDPNVHLG